jgi:UDP-glucose:(heptosyl)LPS alpha-1,3-glucosyltransferase
VRIGLVIETFGRARGGAERMCFALADGLARRGHGVTVFAARFESHDPGIQHEPVPVRAGWFAEQHVSFAENVARLLEKTKFDVVHSFARTIRQDIYRLGGGCHAEYLRRRNEQSGPLGRWFRRHNPKERAILRLERRALSPECTRVVAAVSDRSAQEARDHYDVSDDRLRVVRNGVDITRFHPCNVGLHRERIRAELGLRGRVALFAGSGFERKGLIHAVGAVAQAPGWSLIVMGRGEARRLEISDRVRFVGRQEFPEHFYAAADALILPSLYDPFPNVCLEALATGIPVVTTRVTGVAEILTHGRDGFIVEDARDIGAMVEALGAIPDARMGPAARATAEAHSIDRFVEENLKLYETIASPPA